MKNITALAGPLWRGTSGITLYRAGFRASSRFAPTAQQVRFKSSSGADLRAGTLIWLNGQYVEVTDWMSTKQARQDVFYKISYKCVSGGGGGSKKLSANEKVVIVETVKFKRLVLYVDDEQGGVIVADESFNEEVLPFASLPKDVLSACRNQPDTLVTVVREAGKSGDSEGPIVTVKLAAKSESKLEAFGGQSA